MNVIEKLERLRIAYNRLIRIGGWIVGIGFLLFMADVLGLINEVGVINGAGWIGILIVVGGLAVLGVAFFRYYFPFLQIYKGELIQSILAENLEGYDDLRYFPEDGISKDTIESTGMMWMGNTYSSGDLIEGSYKGVEFRQSDVCIEEVTYYNKSEHRETYLRGRWMIFDFNKRFRSDLQVCEKDFRYARAYGGPFSKGEKMHTLETESIAFNRAFTIAAENDSEAFYILTPHFMEKLLEVKAKISGDLLFCFVDSQLHVAINDEYNNFEPNMAVPVDADRIRRSVWEDLEPITELINILRLDDRLFLTN